MFCKNCGNDMGNSTQCSKCGNQKTVISQSSNTTNSAASIIKGIGIVTVICAVIAGIIFWTNEDYPFLVTTLWWIGGFVSGMLVYALGEIIDLLQKLVNK